MNKNLKCWKKKRMDACNHLHIMQEQDMINHLQITLQNMTAEQAKLDDYFKQGSLQRLLRCNAGYLDGYAQNTYVASFEDKKSKSDPCPYTPESCEGVLLYKKKLREQIGKKLCQKLAYYNATLNIIKKVQHFYRDELEGGKIVGNNVYLQIEDLEEEKRLACYFNIEQFIRHFTFTTIGTLYLLDSEGISPHERRSCVKFQYDGEFLKIGQYHTYEPKNGYEFYLLKHLLRLIPYLNKALTDKGYAPIKVIFSELLPSSAVPRESLVKLYQKMGFELYGKTYTDGTYIPYQFVHKVLTYYELAK